MQRTLIYFASGTLISFLLNYFILGTQGWQLDFYYACAFGLGWGLAYFVDHPEWKISKKLGISFLGIGVLVIIGLLFFKVDEAVPAIIKFSTVFVAYYIIASLRESKSLRQ